MGAIHRGGHDVGIGVGAIHRGARDVGIGWARSKVVGVMLE